jgi:hypothetical protein
MESHQANRWPCMPWALPIRICITGCAVALSAALHAPARSQSAPPASESPPPAAVRAATDAGSGQVDITESGLPVLRYNYQTVQPPDGFLSKVASSQRKYARPRSDYIHPLYGPDGEILTRDWAPDEPHHRGIYWAWPEVDFGDQRGDLHALQRVFARPTGHIKLEHDRGAARIEAESRWLWEDEMPIAREKAVIRVHPAAPRGRFIDLSIEIAALADGVRVARRGTKLYGGLNIRLSPWKDLQLVHHADPSRAAPRMAWSGAAGVPEGGSKAVSLVVFEKITNPDYPGDWIEYKRLPWFQPAFPASGTRFDLKKDRPLALAYRLWIRRDGPATPEEYAAAWREYNPAADHR